MRDFFEGCHYLFIGFKLIFKTKILRYIIIPLTINISLFIGLFVFFSYSLTKFNAWIALFLPAWLAWFSIIIWFAFFIAFFMFMTATFVILANIIMSPFNSLLSEHVVTYLLGKPLAKRTLLDEIKNMPRTLNTQLKVVLYYLTRSLCLLLLLFVPVIQFFVPAISFLFQAWIMSLTYIDYPLQQKNFSFNETKEWLQRRRIKAYGFGTSTLICTLLPGLNLLVIPAAVSGATFWWCIDEYPTLRIKI